MAHCVRTGQGFMLDHAERRCVVPLKPISFGPLAMPYVDTTAKSRTMVLLIRLLRQAPPSFTATTRLAVRVSFRLQPSSMPRRRRRSRGPSRFELGSLNWALLGVVHAVSCSPACEANETSYCRNVSQRRCSFPLSTGTLAELAAGSRPVVYLASRQNLCLQRTRSLEPWYLRQLARENLAQVVVCALFCLLQHSIAGPTVASTGELGRAQSHLLDPPASRALSLRC